jgi:preprotein translocase YajC subunit
VCSLHNQGDLVTTIGGLQGTLVKINDDLGTVEIQVDKGVKLTYLKSSIASSKKK